MFNQVDAFYVVVDCGKPRTLPNSKVKFKETTFGHNATYTCDRGHQFDGGERQVIIECEATGNWTKTNHTCIGRLMCAIV